MLCPISTSQVDEANWVFMELGSDISLIQNYFFVLLGIAKTILL